MNNTKLVALLGQLETVVRAVADEELQGGPTWLGDLSVANIDTVRELRAAAEAGRLMPGPGFDLAIILGASWVELHDEADGLIAQINGILCTPRT